MENAKKFVDYMLSETCQNYVGQNLTVRPLRQNVQLNDSLTPWSEITRLESYDGVWVAANKSAITEKYSDYERIPFPTYEENVEYLREWLIRRHAWLKSYLGLT